MTEVTGTQKITTGAFALDERTELRRSVRSWVIAGLDALQGEEVPSSLRFVYAFSEGAYEGRSVPSPRYDLLVRRNHSTLVDINETVELLDLVRESSKLSSALLVDGAGTPLPHDEEMHYLVSHHLEKMLVEYLKRTGGSRLFHAEVFKGLALELEQFVFERESIDVSWLIHFRNLHMETEDFSLERRVRFRRASDAERTQVIEPWELEMLSAFNGSFMKPYANRFFAQDVPNAFIEVDDKSRRFEVNFTLSQRIAERAILALRLAKPDPIWIHSLWYSDSNTFSQEGPGMPMHQAWDLPKECVADSYYRLTAEDATLVQSLWSKTESALRDTELALAISRLNDSYGRVKLEDILIDYWIALESLFLPDGNVSQMSDSIALAIAHFIGDSAERRRSIHALVKSSHKMRSTIVHPRISQGSRDLAGITAKTGNLVRHALRKRLHELA